MRKYFLFLSLIGITSFSCEKDTASVVEGIVTDKNTGKPMPGVTIQISQSYQSEDSDHLDVIKTGVTDSEGKYSIQYTYKSGKPRGYVYKGCYVGVSEIFYHFDTVGYNRCVGAGELKKKKDTKNFFLYKE
jgi:hypothetical protein